MPIDIICPQCGKPLRVPDTEAGKRVLCPDCQAAAEVPIVAETVETASPFAELPLPQPATSLGDDPAVRLLLPVGRSLWAIAAGYFGLFAVLCFPAPIAVLLGIVAIRDIRKHPEKHGMGRAIFGLVMGILGSLGLVAVLFSM